VPCTRQIVARVAVLVRLLQRAWHGDAALWQVHGGGRMHALTLPNPCVHLHAQDETDDCANALCIDGKSSQLCVHVCRIPPLCSAHTRYTLFFRSHVDTFAPPLAQVTTALLRSSAATAPAL
jgi:hypothetical protein